MTAHRTRPAPALRALILPLLVVPWLAACDDDTQIIPSTSADVQVSADADAVVGSAQVPIVVGTSHGPGPYVELAGTWDAAAKRLRVTVWVGDMSNFLGISGHLRYDPKYLQLTGQKSFPIGQDDPGQVGAFVTRGVLKESPTGRILAGAARFRTTTHPWMYPDGTNFVRDKWLELEFAVLAQGSTELKFDPNSTLARQADGAEIAVQWTTSTVTIPAGSVGGAP